MDQGRMGPVIARCNARSLWDEGLKAGQLEGPCSPELLQPEGKRAGERTAASDRRVRRTLWSESDRSACEDTETREGQWHLTATSSWAKLGEPDGEKDEGGFAIEGSTGREDSSWVAADGRQRCRCESRWKERWQKGGGGEYYIQKGAGRV